MKNNFAIMHSALTSAYMVLVKAYTDHCQIPPAELARVISILEEALALKPRNCDRLNVDDAFGAFTFMCDNTDCKDCPYKQNNKFGDRELCAMLFLYDNGNGGKKGAPS